MSIHGIDPSKTCCFSGYRPHKFGFEFKDNNPEFAKLETDLMNAILKSIEDGYTTFLCGGAMGFDLLGGETVLLLKKRHPELKLISVIAFAGQEKTFPGEWKERYDYVLKNSDCVHKVCKKYAKGSYHMRNYEMIYSSSRVITYFNGRSGGTANTISVAQREGLEILNICPEELRKSEPITFYLGHK